MTREEIHLLSVKRKEEKRSLIQKGMLERKLRAENNRKAKEEEKERKAAERLVIITAKKELKKQEEHKILKEKEKKKERKDIIRFKTHFNEVKNFIENILPELLNDGKNFTDKELEDAFFNVRNSLFDLTPNKEYKLDFIPNKGKVIEHINGRDNVGIHECALIL